MTVEIKELEEILQKTLIQVRKENEDEALRLLREIRDLLRNLDSKIPFYSPITIPSVPSTPQPPYNLYNPWMF